MVWLFDYTAPTFVVLLFFTTYYFLRPVFIANSNRVFLVIVLFELMGFFATFFSSFVDNNYSEYNNNFLIFINNSYYIMYIARYFLFSLYFASILHIKPSKDPLFILDFIFILSVFVLILINPLTSFIYTLSPDSPFNVGKYINLIYYANISTLILDIEFVIKSFKKIEMKIKMSLIFSILILFGCAVTDLFYMDYLVSDMFFILVISILFLTFENPDLYRDKMTSLFNEDAFKDAINDTLYHKREFKLFGFVIKNYTELRQIYGMKHIDLVLKEIGDYLLINFSNLECYYLQNGRFTVIYHDDSPVIHVEKQIERRFENGWKVKNGTNVQLKVVIVDIEDKLDFKSFDKLQLGCDEALYEANLSSKNYTSITTETLSKIEKNTLISKALITSLNHNSLEVYLQPIIDTNNMSIVACEALVRIIDEKMGVIPPDAFIQMAEENGYIEELGEQVLNKVCIFLNDKGISKCHLKWINVNLSPLQCLDSKLIDNINGIVNKNHIDPKYIHLEITEDSMINKDTLKHQMQLLIDNGYCISLDDFGSGFSNLSLIKTLPFNNIKLDLSIVRDHFQSPDIMLPGLVSIFRKKGLSVTAEGVETKEMADELSSIGCNYLQGYYMSRPLPMDDFVKLCEANPKF